MFIIGIIIIFIVIIIIIITSSLKARTYADLHQVTYSLHLQKAWNWNSKSS